MITMLDRDYSGKMGFNEFKELWAALNQWKVCVCVCVCVGVCMDACVHACARSNGHRDFNWSHSHTGIYMYSALNLEVHVLLLNLGICNYLKH